MKNVIIASLFCVVAAPSMALSFDETVKRVEKGLDIAKDTKELVNGGQKNQDTTDMDEYIRKDKEQREQEKGKTITLWGESENR